VVTICNNLQLAEQVTIRTAQGSDLPALEWNGEYSHFRLLYQDIYKSSVRGEAIMWLAEIPGVGVVGQLFVQLVSGREELADGSNRAYIYGFRVQQEYRGRGIGTQMLSIAERNLQQRGYQVVNLNVARDNLQARQLYERHGYRVVAAEPGRWNYVDDFGNQRQVVEPAWRMEKTLTKNENVSIWLD
jgi:ribosomal protein S18 acetylase RimI-like enzyme